MSWYGNIWIWMVSFTTFSRNLIGSFCNLCVIEIFCFWELDLATIFFFFCSYFSRKFRELYGIKRTMWLRWNGEGVIWETNLVCECAKFLWLYFLSYILTIFIHLERVNQMVKGWNVLDPAMKTTVQKLKNLEEKVIGTNSGNQLRRLILGAHFFFLPSTTATATLLRQKKRGEKREDSRVL